MASWLSTYIPSPRLLQDELVAEQLEVPVFAAMVMKMMWVARNWAKPRAICCANWVRGRSGEAIRRRIQSALKKFATSESQWLGLRLKNSA